MKICGVLLTIIWIISQQDPTSAASLRSESQSFNVEDTGIPHFETGSQHTSEGSNHHGNSDVKIKEKPQQRNVYPHERRTRPIYTSKTYFGRSQLLDLPRQFAVNKKVKEFMPTREKTPRYMYPVEDTIIAHHKNEMTNHKHNVPNLSQGSPVVPEDSPVQANVVQILNSNYDLIHDNGVSRVHFESAHDYNPNTIYEQYPQNTNNDQYANYPRQNAKTGFVHSPEHGVNVGQFLGNNAHTQQGHDSRYEIPTAHSQGTNPGYQDAKIVQETRFENNEVNEQSYKYGNPGIFQNAERNLKNKGLEYGANAGSVHNTGYGANAGNVHNSAYFDNAGNVHKSEYVANSNVHKSEYVANSNVHNSAHGTNDGIAYNSGHADFGNRQNSGSNHAEYINHSNRVNQAYQRQYHPNPTSDRVNYNKSPASIKHWPDWKQNADGGIELNAEEHINTYNHDLSYSKNKTEETNLDNKILPNPKDETAVLRNLESFKSEETFKNAAISDQSKIIARYNQLIQSEKDSQKLHTKTSESAGTVPNSDFITDDNLQKEELFRHLLNDKLKHMQSTTAGKDSESAKEDFLEAFEGSGNIESLNEFLPITDPGSSKSGRILDIFSRANDTEQCLTPKNESGHCKGLTECPLLETMENFSSFLQYMCFQKSRLVGICCPDNPVIEISDIPELNSTEKTMLDIEQPSEGCGISTHTRIVGGTLSIPHEFSWMVALLRRGRFYCGGVIINNWYILTAAHCVLGIKLSDLKVRLGEFDFHKNTEHQLDIPVSEIKRHALFVTLTFQHDIALLKLKRKIEYSKFIGSICLPNRDEGDFTARNATVVGWGTVSFGGAASPILRKVTVPVWDNKQCDQTYVFETINNAFMCAGSPENGEDACQGDSGGPLMTMSDGRWSVIGIVSWGRRCGDPTYPGVYTRVTSYLDWIAENAQ